MSDSNTTLIDSLSLAKAKAQNFADTYAKESQILNGVAANPKESKGIDRYEVSPFWKLES